MNSIKRNQTTRIFQAVLVAGLTMLASIAVASTQVGSQGIPVRITGYIAPPQPEPCETIIQPQHGTNVLYSTTCPKGGQTPPEKFGINDSEPKHFSQVRIAVNVVGKDGYTRTEHLPIKRSITMGDNDQTIATYYVEWPDNATQVEAAPDQMLYQYID
jgi:hypothetical protein